MESTFSSPAEAALQREAGPGGLLTSREDLDRVYELERVSGFISDLGCLRVRAGEGGGSPPWGGSPRGPRSGENSVKVRLGGSCSSGALKVSTPTGFP